MSPGLGLLADVVPFSWVDGPGNRYVLFLQGCNFACTACHNPQTIPLATPRARLVTVEQVLTHTAGFPFAPLGYPKMLDREQRLAAFGRWRLERERLLALQKHLAESQLAQLKALAAGENESDIVRTLEAIDAAITAGQAAREGGPRRPRASPRPRRGPARGASPPRPRGPLCRPPGGPEKNPP